MFSSFNANSLSCWILLSALLLALPAIAKEDKPLAMQQRAIKRIDNYIDHFRKTGDMKSQIPDLEQAERELTESNRMFEARGDWKALAVGFIKMGNAIRMQGQWQRAVTCYQQAEDAAKRAHDIDRQAEALSYRALAESSSQEYGTAVADATEALRLAETTKDPELLGKALDQLGNVQLAQGDVAGAAYTFNRQMESARQSKDPMSAYYALLNRSVSYLRVAEQCDFKPMYKTCYDALDLMKADLRQAVKIAEEQGFAHLAQQARKDIEYGEERRQLIRDFKEKPKLILDSKMAVSDLWHPKKGSDVLVNDRFIPAASITSQDLKNAVSDANLQVIKTLNEYREEEKKSGDYAVADARHYFIEGEMKEIQGDNRTALDFFLKAVNALEHDRRTLKDEQSRGTFVEDKINFYYSAILQLLMQHRDVEAFDLFERSRSRALADLLASRKLGLVKPDEQKLYAELTLHSAHIADKQGEMYEEVSKAGAIKNSAKISKLQMEIQDLESEHDKIVARMNKESPRLKNLVVSEPASLKDLQVSMRKEGYEVIQYLVQESGIILWHVSADSIHACNVFIPRTKVAEKVAALRKSLEPDDQGKIPAFDETVAKELFLFLINPVQNRIKSDRIVIIPHEEINYVPFQTLVDPASGRFLGESLRISYAPSITILLGSKPSLPLSGSSLLAIADPSILYAEKEVQSIARLFPDRTKVNADGMPKECSVKAWIRDYDVVHLSVHGNFNSSEPMMSYLKLGAGGGDDGNLTAAEMYGLPLDKNKLVVLSACETGKTKATHGNEILGMVRGLLFAGANSLLLSNWRVDSETTMLWMQAFYEKALTRPLAEAAQAALFRVKGDPRYAHPYYWAAFTLIGR